MTKSPCIIFPGTQEPCEHQFRNKNHEDCVNCEFRVQYAVKKGMLPDELLKKEEPMETQKREKGKDEQGKAAQCSTPGCAGVVNRRGMCDKCYRIWARKNPDKLRPYNRAVKSLTDAKAEKYDIRLQIRPGSPDNRFALLKRTAEIASLEFRTLQDQIYFWLKESIERYEKGSGNG